MTGETLNWYRLADRLKMPVDEVKAKTTSSQFMDWMAFLEWELNSFHRLDHFLAQIACEVRRVLSSDPNKITLDQFLLNFVRKKPEESVESEKLSDEELIAKKSMLSKAYWFSLFGMKPPE